MLAVFLSQIPSDTPFYGLTIAGSVVLVGAGDISRYDNNNDAATAKLLDNIPGNHEYFTPEAVGYFQYFNDVPPYYAYDVGEWRIYALNSEIDVSSTGAQVQWLKNDLAANPRLCVLAYWHRPLWSSRYDDGSDATYETLWKTLHDAGADLVINGHIHNYERFKEMNAERLATSPGLREIVVGTGGVNLDGYVTSLPTTEVRNASTYGVLKLILGPNNYSWQFVPVAGETFNDSGGTNCH